MHETSREEPATGVVYRFGLFVLESSALALTRNGIRVRLQDQPLQVLALLLEKSGEIVTREELRQKLWTANTFVDFDKSLGVAVLKVREALGDSAANPTFLETLPRRGYRFIAPVSVEVLSGGSTLPASIAPTDAPSTEPMSAQSITLPPESSESEEKRSQTVRRRTLWVAGAALCLTLALALTAVRFRFHSWQAATSSPATPVQLKVRRSVAVLGFRN